MAITSIAVRQPIPELILSNTARAGVTGFLKTLALEVAADGVTVNSIQPGLHDTDRLKALHGGDPSQLADVDPGSVRSGDPTTSARSSRSSAATRRSFITGAALPVDGGTYRALL